MSDSNQFLEKTLESKAQEGDIKSNRTGQILKVTIFRVLGKTVGSKAQKVIPSQVESVMN